MAYYVEAEGLYEEVKLTDKQAKERAMRGQKLVKCLNEQYYVFDLSVLKWVKGSTYNR